MKELLYRPEIYGRLNMHVQAKFKSTYGLALYENCIRYQDIKQTPWINLGTFRKLMGVETGKYTVFRDFKRRVLDKAITEVNEYSPIKIYSPTREISVSDINKQTKLSDIIGVISQQTLTKIESHLLSPHKSPILGPIIIQQSQEDLPVETCCVCLEEEVSQQNLLKCKHAVCGTCLPQFTDPRCPECRLPFNGGVMTKDIIENIQKRKKSGQEEEERIERIRDVMMGRASLILNTQYNVDQFDAAEYTRQSLRDFNPGNFTNVHERLTPVNLVVNDVMDNYGYGINRENLRQSIDSAYTLLESDLFL